MDRLEIDSHRHVFWVGDGGSGLVPDKKGQWVRLSDIAPLLEDAARYRWLREHTVATGLSRWMGSRQFLDDAIDAERGV